MDRISCDVVAWMKCTVGGRSGPCRHHKRSTASTKGLDTPRPGDDEAGVRDLYGGWVTVLGWLTRDLTVGGRAAPSAADWALALALFGVGLIEILGGTFPGPVGLVATVLCAGALLVAFRRVAPGRAIALEVVVLLPYVVGWSGDFAAGGSITNAATGLLLVYSVGRHAKGRELFAGSALALVLAIEPGIGSGHLVPSEWAPDMLFAVVVLALGVALRTQTDRAIKLAVAAERARSESNENSWVAVQDERARIAHEMHDVVAHNVGLIVLQAGGARSVLEAAPDLARAALLQVEQTGRQTLDEMRHLVGILRVGKGREGTSVADLESSSATTGSLDPVAERRAPSRLDWLLTLGFVLLAVGEAANGVFPGPPWLAAAVLTAGLVPVAFRRVAPLAAITVSTALLLPWVLAVGAVNNLSQLLGELLLVYALGNHARGRRLLVGVAVGATLFVAEGVRGLLPNFSDWAYASLLWFGALGLGAALRIQTQHAIALAVSAERAEREAESAARASVQQERARIARELHDVVADKVGLIVLQAGGARSVLATDPARARAALEQVEETGRLTLAEMRHLVGILGGGEDEERRPLPCLERLPDLIDEARAGGLTVDLAVEGAPVELPAGLELAAYRLVQEALTNARKHAPASTVRVCLGYEPERVRVEVTDDGPPPGSMPAPVRTPAGSGHGLIGMRERVRLYGGRLQTGRVAGGGFRVEAILPVAAVPS
jgi:signal transduction histidine kinase